MYIQTIISPWNSLKIWKTKNTVFTKLKTVQTFRGTGKTDQSVKWTRTVCKDKRLSETQDLKDQ